MNEVCSEIRDGFLGVLCQRFGFEKSLFDSYRFLMLSKKRVQIVPSDHFAPNRLTIETPGMNFIKLNGKVPKLSTSATSFFGENATKNVIHLTRDEFIKYCRQEAIEISDDRHTRIKGRGYVIVKYDGSFPGQGFAEKNEVGYVIRSRFPKGRGWHLRA